MMNALIPVRAEDPFSEPDIHDAWDAQEAAQPTLAERLARLQAAMTRPEYIAALKAGDERREREAIRKEAKQDELFAQLSRQFLRMWRDA